MFRPVLIGNGEPAEGMGVIGRAEWGHPVEDEPVASREDEAALVAAAQREPAAFGRLYAHFVRSVYRYCYRRLGSHELAEDATSTTFVKAFAALERFQAGTVRGWLFTIAERTVTDLLRKRRPWVALESAEAIGSDEPDPQELAMLAETRQSVTTLLSRLTEEQRAIVQLRLAGLTGPEIAEALGKRPEAIKSAQFRAYARLRKWLEAENEGATRS
jgi:RNA polymerase sigma-70 factor (ECF subfamily)